MERSIKLFLFGIAPAERILPATRFVSLWCESLALSLAASFMSTEILRIFLLIRSLVAWYSLNVEAALCRHVARRYAPAMWRGKLAATRAKLAHYPIRAHAKACQ